MQHRTIWTNKVWKRDGENNERDTPSRLKKALRAKHEMGGHRLATPSPWWFPRGSGQFPDGLCLCLDAGQRDHEVQAPGRYLLTHQPR